MIVFVLLLHLLHLILLLQLLTDLVIFGANNCLAVIAKQSFIVEGD